MWSVNSTILGVPSSNWRLGVRQLDMPICRILGGNPLVSAGLHIYVDICR